MTFVADLEPTALWRHFDTILTIPRGSKNEEQIRRYVLDVAARAGLACEVDGTGNVVVRKNGTAGHEGAAPTVLQSHLDMVNEKNSDVEHDFAVDAIRPARDGAYLTAVGTTLGSDNGIGVATMLAVMEAAELTHGPLEFLFTVDEETGLTGASTLDESMLRGRRLLNLDSEEEGVLYVGCAGGGESTLTTSLADAPAPAGSAAFEIRAAGLKGGHSGCDIHLQRGNAVKLLARALNAVRGDVSFHLAAFGGGNAHNAIPREAFATVVVGPDAGPALASRLHEEWDAIGREFAPAEPSMALAITPADLPDAVWDAATTRTVLDLVDGLPHGVVAMSYDIPDLVETSTNLATVGRRDGDLVIGLSSRSSVDSALHAARQRIRAVGTLAGATVEEDEPYPGWKPDLESPLLSVVKEVHERVLGSAPEIKAVHAGLECGIIGKKIPGIDMISFGPQIEFPHSPDERVHVASVERFYRLLTATLEVLAQ